MAVPPGERDSITDAIRSHATMADEASEGGLVSGILVALSWLAAAAAIVIVAREAIAYLQSQGQPRETAQMLGAVIGLVPMGAAILTLGMVPRRVLVAAAVIIALALYAGPALRRAKGATQKGREWIQKNRKSQAMPPWVDGKHSARAAV
jgi:hypothetical protein